LRRKPKPPPCPSTPPHPPHPAPCAQARDSGSLRYLAYKPHDDTLPRQLWPQFASGRVYISSSLSSLLCQSYYNPSLVPILAKLIDPAGEAMLTRQTVPASATGEGASESGSQAPSTAGAPAGGAPSAPAALRSPAGTLRHIRASLAAVDAAALKDGMASPSHAPPPAAGGGGTGGQTARGGGGGGGGADIRYLENAHLTHMRVPTAYVGRRYGDLFIELVLTRNMLPLALYRSNTVHHAPLPYVVTNPPPAMRLSEEDRLMVLVGDDVLQSAAAGAAAVVSGGGAGGGAAGEVPFSSTRSGLSTVESPAGGHEGAT
jgi:hypothetical protein